MLNQREMSVVRGHQVAEAVLEPCIVLPASKWGTRPYFAGSLGNTSE